MKLDTTNNFGLNYISGQNQRLMDLVRNGLSNHHQAIPDNEVKEQFGKWIEHVTDIRLYPAYVFSENARHLYQTITVDKTTPFSIFLKLSVHPVTYCLDRYTFARFFIDEESWLQGVFVRHRPLQGDVLVKPIWAEMKPHDIISNTAPVDEELQELVRAIIYVELTDTTFKVISSGQSTGTHLRKVINGTKRNFTLVDNAWNQKTIILRETEVRGHIRRVWVGKGRTELREVFINPFKRKGYIRNAGNGK